MEKASTFGAIKAVTMASGSRIRLMGTVNTFGQTVECLSEIGLIIICTVMELTLGRMVEATKVTISTTKSKDLGSTHGQMDVSTTACGRMANNTGKASTFCLQVFNGVVFGAMAIVRSGWTLQAKALQLQETQPPIQVETLQT